MDQVRGLAEEYTLEAGEKLLHLDEQFHRWLLLMAGNRRVEQIVGSLLDIMYRDRAFNVAHGYKETRDNLLQIEAAIRAGDQARVTQLFVEHIAGNFPLAAGPVDV
jgi:DNA-binding GntR family transcriptional regulator